MRSYKAARRRAQRENLGFDYAYELQVPEMDADGEPTGRKVWEERTEHFEVSGRVDTLLLSELAYNADVDTATPEGMSLIREFFSQAIGDEEEYRRFFRLHTRFGDDELLMEIMAGLVEDLSGRPTGRPSDSPDGPSMSGDSSKVVSLSRASVEVVPGEVLEEEWALQEAAEEQQTQASASSG